MDLLPLEVDGNEIKLTPIIKSGLLISENLKWDEQVDVILVRVRRILYLLNAYCKSLPIFLKKRFI